MKQASKQKFTQPHHFLIKPNKKSCSNPRRSCFLTTTEHFLHFVLIFHTRQIIHLRHHLVQTHLLRRCHLIHTLHLLRYQGQAPHRRYHWHSVCIQRHRDCNTLSLGPETVLVLELLTGIGMSLSLTFHHSIRQYHLQKVSAVCTHIKVVFPKFHFKAKRCHKRYRSSNCSIHSIFFYYASCHACFVD